MIYDPERGCVRNPIPAHVRTQFDEWCDRSAIHYGLHCFGQMVALVAMFQRSKQVAVGEHGPMSHDDFYEWYFADWWDE